MVVDWVGAIGAAAGGLGASVAAFLAWRTSVAAKQQIADEALRVGTAELFAQYAEENAMILLTLENRGLGTARQLRIVSFGRFRGENFGLDKAVDGRALPSGARIEKRLTRQNKGMPLELEIEFEDAHGHQSQTLRLGPI